jgi:hypothetical protein
MIKQLSKHFTFFNFMLAFISLLLGILFKFIILPYILALFSIDLTDMVKYIISGVLVTGIRLALRGILEEVFSEHFPLVMTMNTGNPNQSSPPPSGQSGQPIAGPSQSPQSGQSGQPIAGPSQSPQSGQPGQSIAGPSQSPSPSGTPAPEGEDPIDRASTAGPEYRRVLANELGLLEYELVRLEQTREIYHNQLSTEQKNKDPNQVNTVRKLIDLEKEINEKNEEISRVVE